jgi:hypothetical protein
LLNRARSCFAALELPNNQGHVGEQGLLGKLIQWNCCDHHEDGYLLLAAGASDGLAFSIAILSVMDADACNFRFVIQGGDGVRFHYTPTAW